MRRNGKAGRGIAVVAGAGVIVALVGLVLSLGQPKATRTCPAPPAAAVASALGAGGPAPHGVVFSASVLAAEAASHQHPSITRAQVLTLDRAGAQASANVVLGATGPYGTFAIPESFVLSCSGTEWVLRG